MIMKNSDSNSKNTMDEEVECEVRPGGMLVQRRGDEHDQDPHDEGPDGVIGGSLIKLSVTQGRFKARDNAHHELSVPESYTFGDVKKVLAEITGIDPVEQKLLFRGEEKEDSEKLQEVGVRDKAKLVLLMEPTVKEKKAEETKPDVDNDIPEENNEKKEQEDAEMLNSFKAIDVVRQEVDKIAERVSALEVAVNCGNKLTNEEFIVPSELLMRQLLKLDTIEAEGEARLQRKAEVVRVQKFHDILDELKTKNSKPNDDNNSSSTTTTSSVTSKWETFDSGVGSLNPPPPISSSSSSSSPTITQDWEQFD